MGIETPKRQKFNLGPTRLLGATTRRFRLILSGREACRANGSPGEYTTKLCPEVLGRLLRSHRTCCSYVTRHHSKKSANLRVRSAPDVLSFESSNSNARPHASLFVWTKTIAIAGQNPDTSRLPCNTLLAERRVLLSRESVAATLQVLVQVVGREEAVLAVRAEHPRGAVAARHATISDAVQQGAAAEAVVAVHAARDLTRGIEALDPH